ncbi:MICAL C-terminal-like protein [Thalassophryne amazonica]|uniref:MICAL C-terminal-like protein n=1 Tax=Thalassophryne amazonica TaxID=390379 RepID=UPI001470B23D|nr:MICAL C-terminal-like protein [Thalassophryne amazonica]
MIQRLLQQVEEKQKELEQRGVKVEKALRGEADVADLDSSTLMQQWFQLVQQKNALVRYESKLMIFARELELEDRQNCLLQDLRERVAVADQLKGEVELQEERMILEEMLEVVEQRHSLDHQLDWDLDTIMLSQELDLHFCA